MKKLITIVFGSVLLVGCGPQPPNYEAWIKDADEVSVYPLSTEPNEMIETANFLCAQSQVLGEEAAIELISIGLMVGDENAVELFESLDKNVCSRL